MISGESRQIDWRYNCCKSVCVPCPVALFPPVVVMIIMAKHDTWRGSDFGMSIHRQLEKEWHHRVTNKYAFILLLGKKGCGQPGTRYDSIKATSQPGVSQGGYAGHGLVGSCFW